MQSYFHVSHTLSHLSGISPLKSSRCHVVGSVFALSLQNSNSVCLHAHMPLLNLIKISPRTCLLREVYLGNRSLQGPPFLDGYRPRPSSVLSAFFTFSLFSFPPLCIFVINVNKAQNVACGLSLISVFLLAGFGIFLICFSSCKASSQQT